MYPSALLNNLIKIQMRLRDELNDRQRRTKLRTQNVGCKSVHMRRVRFPAYQFVQFRTAIAAIDVDGQVAEERTNGFQSRCQHR